MQIPHLIKNKSMFYDLARRGLLGNQLRVWYSAKAFRDSGYEGTIGLRYTGTASAAPWLGNKIPAECAVETLELLCEQEGYKPEDYVFCEAAPDHFLTIQGELQQSVGGLELRYTSVRDAMRDAFKEENIRYHGVETLYLLQKHLSPASYEDIQILLDWFPGHVIEFAAFSIPVGWAKGRNTVIWEVRKDGIPPGWYAVERSCRRPGECIE